MCVLCFVFFWIEFLAQRWCRAWGGASQNPANAATHPLVNTAHFLGSPLAAGEILPEG
jgi:hypothetical protein